MGRPPWFVPQASLEDLGFPSGSSAPVRVEHEGCTAAWPLGTPAAPSVQDMDCLCSRSYVSIRVFFFEPLVAGSQKASLASLSP